MQDIKSKKLRDRISNVNTRICFEVGATAQYPRLHTKVFSLCPHKTFHKGTSTEELQIQTESTQLQLSLNRYTRGYTQSKEKYNLVITWITNNTW